MVEFNYDAEVDILVIDRESRAPEEYEKSLPLGDYIVDLDQDGEFIGLELLNASKNLPFSKEELENIKDVKLDLKESDKATTIGLDLKYSDSRGKLSFGYGKAIA